jgi:hypothetical protein
MRKNQGGNKSEGEYTREMPCLREENAVTVAAQRGSA